MPAILEALPAALQAARAGMSANEFGRWLTTIGMGARRAEVLGLYREARRLVRDSPDEIFRDITKAPTVSETIAWPSRKSTKLRQNVTLVYRDRVTGTIRSTKWSSTGEQAIKRETAMASAISAYGPHAEEYGQDLIGAVHTGSYRYTPFE